MPNNPKISPVLRFATAAEVLVLVITGFGLMFFSGQIAPLWPWDLTPFNTGFLGAVYLSSLIATVILVWKGTWFPARIVTVMVLTFTSIVFFVSLAYFGNFDASKSASIWGWFFLYSVLPLNAAYHLWLYRGINNPDKANLPAWLRTYLLIQASIYGLYGLGLLLFPIELTSFWPWAIDAFHGRMYSVAFLTPAVGAFLVLRDANPQEMKALGWTQLVGGILPVLGLIMVELNVQRINWAAWGTWLWLANCLILIPIGLGLLRTAK
jgi:hypothetical protein